jgi:hypothetical protein
MRGRGVPGLAAAALSLVVAVLGAAGAASAQAQYEPNNSTLEAMGPLLAAQTYSTDIGWQGDRDFFFFYVAVKGSVVVEPTLQNRGGGSPGDLQLTILDTGLTPVASQAFIRKGETRITSVQLPAGKYFAEVTANEGLGDAYELSARGGEGAFVDYATIAGRCERAQRRNDAAKRGLSRAQAKLQRAVGRLRRSLYSGPRALKRARFAHRRALKRVRAMRKQLKTKRRLQFPWCSIER